MGDLIRAFIAIPLPREVTDYARSLQERLLVKGLGMRWVRPGAIHLTLKFLGDIDRSRVPEIGKAMEAAAGTTGPLALAAKGIGVFPDVKKARVLWMGIAGEIPRLRDTRQRLEEQLAPLGHKPERGRFSAHLTLARAGGRLDPRLLVSCIETVGGFEAVSFTARQIVLYQSELKPDGAVYTALASMDFAKLI